MAVAERPTVRAEAKYVRTAPRKAQLVAEQIRGRPSRGAHGRRPKGRFVVLEESLILGRDDRLAHDRGDVLGADEDAALLPARTASTERPLEA